MTRFHYGVNRVPLSRASVNYYAHEVKWLGERAGRGREGGERRLTRIGRVNNPDTCHFLKRNARPRILAWMAGSLFLLLQDPFDAPDKV